MLQLKILIFKNNLQLKMVTISTQKKYNDCREASPEK